MTAYDPTDHDIAVMARLGMGHPPCGPLTEAQQADEDAYDAYCEAMERQCGNGISTGGFDPYGTHCHLDAGHAGPHEGPDFFGEGTLRWTGGGSCAGDALPFSIVERVKGEDD